MRKVVLLVLASIVAASVIPLLAIGSGAALPAPPAYTGVDARAFAAYTRFGATCPGLRFQLLAAIGWIESGHGTAGGAIVDPVSGAVSPPIFGPALDGTLGPALPSGAWRGQWGLTGPWLRALGPMQLLSPTFSAWAVDGDGDGALDPHDIDDAVASAASYLCGTSDRVTDERAAVLRYNHSSSYADAVLRYADELGAGVLGAIVCPVAGRVAFSDTWGAPRSGGRTHKGVDMFATRGAPVVAPVDGELEHYNDSLGGLAFRLWGDDGTYYYGTHLAAYGPTTGHVAAGTIAGYVGDTGNAAGTGTHLHFEIHPGRGRGDPATAINPTPTVATACSANRIGVGARGGD